MSRRTRGGAGSEANGTECHKEAPPSEQWLQQHLEELFKKTSPTIVWDKNVKMYHVMSAKQSFREDLDEHSYQFSCRASDWSCMSFANVPLQFEPVELHVVDALGQQDVPECFQQPAKAITGSVRVMRGPQAEAWIQAVLEEIASFKKPGVYEEVSKGSATSIPLPARLVLVTNPNVHGGPARKKARIVIGGSFRKCTLTSSPLLRLLAIHLCEWHCLWPHIWVGPWSVRSIHCLSLC